MAAKVCMSKGEAVKEHENLVRILRSGSPKQRNREAKEQSKELSGYRKVGRAKGRR